MIVIDSGHKYALARLDGEGVETLTFVKRIGDKFPGNNCAYTGTTLQECWRAEIERLKYVDNQIPDMRNSAIITNLRENIHLLEMRAAERHNRILRNVKRDIENEPVCRGCGHIQHQCEEYPNE